MPTKDLSDLVIVSAKLASGFFRPTKRTEVVWVDGDSELAVGVAAVGVETTDGLVRVKIPVRCDETGPAAVEVVFAVGSPGRPAGVYASTYRRPVGPALIVDVWGEALVAFAWQTVLGLVSQLAAAAGKDERGNRLVPAHVVASKGGLSVEPMPRHRFFGSTGLLGATT